MERSEGFGDSVLAVRGRFRLFRLYATTTRSSPKSLISLRKFGILVSFGVEVEQEKEQRIGREIAPLEVVRVSH